MQGDILEACPVAIFADKPGWHEAADLENLLKVLRESVGITTVRAIVMTQACDLLQGKVRYAILCPVYRLDEFRIAWEQRLREAGQLGNERNWQKELRNIRDGRIWNLTMLSDRPKSEAGGLLTPHLIVDFHEVFSLPIAFVEAWTRKTGGGRLRLRPPYREHLSQSFARYFMRVGLPVDIELP